MASTPYLVARIVASPTGHVTIAVVETPLSRGAASLLAKERAAQTGQVHFVGSSRLRQIDVLLPPTAEAMALGPPSALAARLAAWIDLLRAHGELSLRHLAGNGPAQAVPAARLVDPQVLAGLGIVLTPMPRCEDRDALDAMAWIAAAPRHSVAGLLHRSPLADDFQGWFSSLPMATRPSLRIPLFHMVDDAQNGLRLGIWVRRESDHPFLAGEALQVAVLPTGLIAAWMLPICRDGDPWRSAGAAPDATDLAWQYQGDPRLDRLFHALPALAERILLEAAGQAIQAGTEPSQVLDPLRPFRRRLDRQIGASSRTRTWQLLKRCGLEGALEPRLSHARFLHTHGDPLAATRRRQVFAAWPALAADFAGRKLPTACEAIDAGRPLVPALAADYGVPGWAVRRLLKLLGEVRDVRGFGGASGLAGCLHMIGPHAPAISPTVLDTLAHWMRLPPQGHLEIGTRALMRALGAEATRTSWDDVAALLDRPDIGDEGIALLAWWDDLRHNVADVLTRTLGEVDADQIDATFLAWIEHVPITTALRLAAGWHGLLWGPITGDDDGSPEAYEVPGVFGALSLLRSRVQVTPIRTLDALRDEGTRMRHCVASYWRAVAGARRLVCSLECTETGARGTAAWTCAADGTWTRHEAAGEGNAKIAENGRIAAALFELEALLADERCLDPEAVERHRHAAVVRIPKGADYAVEGACLVSMLPEGLARVAMRWVPGMGSIDSRVAHACRKAFLPAVNGRRAPAVHTPPIPRPYATKPNEPFA